MISKQDIQTFVDALQDKYEWDYLYPYTQDIYNELSSLYTVINGFDISDEDMYCLQNILESIISKKDKLIDTYSDRRKKLHQLKLLILPEQRSPEWYEMRRDKLTASSIASALGKCHFTTRDELLLSKIEEKPYEPNPITEHGVKYEDVAIQFYEEMYNTKVVDFGMIPHPEFNAFGASPDGICDDTGNDEYMARMVEIKCPPKRKFTKTVPPHYKYQVQGQLEVCDLDECDFFQVKISDYESLEDYKNDVFMDEDNIVPGRTILNYPKGVTLTYKVGEKLSYVYCEFNKHVDEYLSWIDTQPTENLFETKWWKIERYETTLVMRDREWWIDNVEHILTFYKDLLYYREGDNKQILKDRIAEKKKKKKTMMIELDDFILLSDDES